MTYRELRRPRVRASPVALVACGVRPGDRVAAILPNVPEMLELHFAVPAAGAVLVPDQRPHDRRGARLHPRALRRRASWWRTRASRDGGATAVAALADPPQVIMTRAEPGDGSEYEERLAAAAPRRDHAAGRRERPALDQLHERHHRPAEGCHVHPPRRVSAHVGRHRRGTARHPHRVPVDAADVPLQRLGVHVGGDGDGRRASLPGAVRRRKGVGRCSRRGRSAISAARRPCSRCSRAIRPPHRCRAR